MSKYLTYTKVSFKNKTFLIEALKACGFTDIEVGENLNLVGYQGDKRAETADIVIRRKHVGSSSNDVGFRREANGSYTPIISQFDSSRWDSILGNVQVEYVGRMAKKHAAMQGYQMPTQSQQGDVVKYTVTV